jgi:AraC family transcriptional activator of tynA and feaB
MQKVLTTSDAQPRDRLAYWYDVASKVFVDHECRIGGPSTFDVTLHHAELGKIDVVDINSVGLHEASRPARSIAHGEDDVFFLCLQVSGTSAVSQDGRHTTIHPGDFVLQDAQRPYSCRYSPDWRQIIIKIPHRAMKARLAPSSQLTACAVRHTTGIGGLASDYVRMIRSRIDDLPPTAHGPICEQALDLIALALAAEGGKDRPALSSARATALLHLRTAIECRLRDPALDPGMAAAAAGISVRYANALLAEEGSSLERLIVWRRLERCRLDLEDASQNHRTISELAYAWGFSDLSHFNRRFKAAFGSSPREHRRQRHG